MPFSTQEISDAGKIGIDFYLKNKPIDQVLGGRRMKSLYRSLTLWFNGIVTSLPALIPLLAEQLPALEQYVPGNIYRVLFVVLVVGNVFIRVFFTKTALRVLPPLVK